MIEPSLIWRKASEKMMLQRMRRLLKQQRYLQGRKRKQENKCRIKLFPNYEKWIRTWDIVRSAQLHSVHIRNEKKTRTIFVSLSKECQTRNIRLKSESLQMPLKLFPEYRSQLFSARMSQHHPILASFSLKQKRIKGEVEKMFWLSCLYHKFACAGMNTVPTFSSCN